MHTRAFLFAAGCTAIGMASMLGQARPVHAQDAYPSRPVVLVLPYAAGGAADIFGRRLAARLTDALGANFVVDAKGGAGGTIGTRFVANAKPDGYTLLLGATGSHVINPLTWATPPFDPLEDFTPIAVLTRQPMVLAVNPALGVETVADLVKMLRSNPGKYTYASAGAGALGHLTAELFLRAAGNLKVGHAPYKGGGPAMVDVMAGHVPFVWEVLGAVLPHQRVGKLKVLAVAGEKRAASLPDVPTTVEAGLKDVIAETNFFLLTPAKTPSPIIEKLSKATAASMADPALQKELEDSAVEAVTDSNPEHARQFIKESLERWRPIVDSLDIKRN